jgi:hypothetical protein
MAPSVLSNSPLCTHTRGPLTDSCACSAITSDLQQKPHSSVSVLKHSTYSNMFHCLFDLTMGKHPKPPSAKFGKCHFTPALRKRACSCFKAAHFSLYHFDLGSVSHYKGKSVAGHRDGVWHAAFQTFVQGFPARERIPLPREITYKNYKDLVKKWYDSWNRGCDCARESERSSNVPIDSLYRLASLVASGKEGIDGSWTYFESIQQASKSCAELRDRISQYCLLPSTLHNLLVHKHKYLKYKRPDQRSRHAKSTLLKRQACSAIWAGTKPWLTTVSGTRAESRIDVHFEWSWYSNLKILLDAVSFEDCEAATAFKSAKVYTLNEATYPPHLLPPKQRIDATNRAMFYIVLHPHEGAILGPDLVYTGSKVAQSDKSKKDEIMKPWCVSLLKCVYLNECASFAQSWRWPASAGVGWTDWRRHRTWHAWMLLQATHTCRNKSSWRVALTTLLNASVFIWFQAFLVAWSVPQRCTWSCE